MKFLTILLLSLATFPVISFSQSDRYISTTPLTSVSTTPLTSVSVWRPEPYTVPAIGRPVSDNVFLLRTAQPGDEVITTYDTTILYKGIDTVIHLHEIVRKKEEWFGTIRICAALHGPEGCPDDWFSYEAICTFCLLNFKVTEHRIVKPKIDKFQEAKTRLNNLLKK